MKIGITGHTSGLGKALFDNYQSLGHECIGFSRTNGYNIVDNFDEIAAMAETLDLFINNAWCLDAQTKFVKHLKNYPVDIISIGTSATIFYDEKILVYTGWKHEYLSNKQSLVNEHKNSSYSSVNNMLLINVDTLENHPTKSDCSMKFADVIALIDFWMKNKHITMVNYANRSN